MRILEKRWFNASLLTAVGLIMSTIVTTAKNPCSWEGCSWQAGFPIVFINQDGVGGTGVHGPDLIKAILLYFLIAYVVLWLFEYLKLERNSSDPSKT